jgi:two-component system response regulator AtoC
VIVWDHRRARLHLVSRVIAECGARPRWIDDLSTIQETEFSVRESVVLVALGGSPSSGSLGLEVVRCLKQKGFNIICYEDGARAWPLGVRCQALLAGALWVLDSAASEFSHELARLLAQLLSSETGRWGEETRIKAEMRKLGVAGESPAMLAAFRLVLRISRMSDISTLITGETGTGKQLLAHAIYQLDPKRRHGPFVAVNCGAISHTLAESELFGHRRGAYTGAERDRKGLIRTAHGGVLFLDEISELDPALQTKLLRVLQENRVLGVGEDQEVAVSVRVIAATNRDLDQMVRLGTFRADLFHRLKVLAIHIPPLRERPEDIQPLIEHFLEKHQLLNLEEPRAVRPDFIEALTQLALPGNARQLENLVRQALVNKEDDAPLSLSDLPAEVWRQLSQPEPRAPQPLAPPAARPQGETALRFESVQAAVSLLEENEWNLSRSLQSFERYLIEAAMQQARWNQSQAARLLGITPRSVYNKVRKHHLRP